LIIYFYHTGNIIKQELIIQKTYNIKYYKLISLDLEKYPYIIFIFKSIHSYLLLLLNHILNTIYTHLYELINKVNNNITNITLTHIIISNLYNIIILY